MNKDIGWSSVRCTDGHNRIKLIPKDLIKKTKYKLLCII